MLDRNGINSESFEAIRDNAALCGTAEELDKHLRWLDKYGGPEWKCLLYDYDNNKNILFYMYKNDKYRFHGSIRLDHPKKHSICDIQCHYHIYTSI